MTAKDNLFGPLADHWRSQLANNENIISNPLHGGGGGGTFGSMDAVDAKIAASEARTDTKFAELLGEMRLMNQRLDHVETQTSGLRLNVWLASATAVALVVAIFGWGTSMFGVGMDAQQVSDRAVSSAIQRIQPQVDAMNANYSEVSNKLDQLLRATGPRPNANPSPGTSGQ